MAPNGAADTSRQSSLPSRVLVAWDWQAFTFYVSASNNLFVLRLAR